MTYRRNAKPVSRWLNSTVFGIGMASLFSDAGHEMATTAMPALLAALGARSPVLGLIEGVSDGLASFTRFFSGLCGDRLKRRKPLAVFGYFVTASGMAGLALATQWWHVLLGRVFAWMGRGARTPVRNVLLVEATSPQTYGRAFGLERAMDSAGAVCGPAAALLLLSALGTSRLDWLFVLTAIPGALAVLCIALLVREKPHLSQHRSGILDGMTLLPTRFYRYVLGVGIAGIGDFSNTLLILWATEAWTPRWGLQKATDCAIAFYIGYNVIYTFSCSFSGNLADHFSKTRVLAGGYILAVIPAFALMLPSRSLLKFAVVFAFSGLYMGVWETLENSTAAAILPIAIRGIGFGLLATVQGLGDLVSSIVVGFLWILHPAWAMAFVIVASIVGAVIIAGARIQPVPAANGGLAIACKDETPDSGTAR